MKLLTKTQRLKLIANGKASAMRETDHFPVVKLFTPDANATWLLSEIRADDPDIAFGLCDLGLGEPELGYVRLAELERLRGPFRLPVERDEGFKADRTLTAYAAAARLAGRIMV